MTSARGAVEGRARAPMSRPKENPRPLGRGGGQDPYTFFMFLLIASIPMMMGHTVFNYLLGRYRAVTIAASTLGEPVGATLLAVPILGEVPTGTVTLGAGVALPLQAIGIAVTLLGLFVVIREEIKASR